MTTSEKVKTKAPTKAIVYISAALLFGAGVAAVIFLNPGSKVSTNNTAVATANTNTTNTNATATTTTPVGMYRQIWISQAEIDALPNSGALWGIMKNAADSTFPVPMVCASASDHDMYTLAAALVWAKTQIPAYRTKAANAIVAAIGTEDTEPCPGIVSLKSQGLERNGAGYVMAADIINLPNLPDDPLTPIVDEHAFDGLFRTWISVWRTRVYDSGLTLVDWMEDRPNNMGFYAGATLAAAYAYLGDTTGLNHVLQVFKGALGDRSSWSAWNVTPSTYMTFVPDGQPFRPINPSGAVKSGYNVDGYAVWEWGRCGSFTTIPPPCYTDYIWTVEGLLIQAEILENMGKGDAFAFEQNALQRMIDAIHRQYVAGRTEFWSRAKAMMSWQPYFTNYAYGTNYPETVSSGLGFQMGWSWQFEGRSRTAPPSGGGGPDPFVTQ